MSALVAPTAPGRLGEQIEPAALQTYLTALESWVQRRRAELADIDTAALASPQRDAVAGDIALAMSLWKAVADRFAQMWQVWDGGRVGPTERERLSTLIWGRLDDASAAAVAVSVPESCRLCDALASQLRARLALSPAREDAIRRIEALRAQIERLRDQITLEPAESAGAAAATFAQLAARVEDVRAKADRGADVGGLLGPLEIAAAGFERDLIVGGVKRRETRDQISDAEQLRAALEAREAQVRSLADAAVASVLPVPKYAVPDVSQLPATPSDAAQLPAFLASLDRVDRAMDLVQDRYAAALAARDQVQATCAAAVQRAKSVGLQQDPDIAAAIAAVEEVLGRVPTPVPVAAAQVGVLTAWLDLKVPAAPTSGTTAHTGGES